MQTRPHRVANTHYEGEITSASRHDVSKKIKNKKNTYVFFGHFFLFCYVVV